MARPGLSIRKATPEDRRAMRELCLSAVGPDDYVPPMMDELLKSSTAFIALDGRKVVGMMFHHVQLDGSAWIFAARTRPEYRRKGVAASLIRACDELAREDGVGQLRLWTESVNESGKAAFMKTGFREVGRFTRMSAPPAEKGLREDVRPLAFSERLWTKVESSEVLRKSNFYLNHGVGFLKVTRPIFKRLVDDGFLYGWGRNIAVMSESMHGGVITLEAHVLLGDLPEALGELRAIAKAYDMECVRTFLPHDAQMIEAATAAEFALIDWGNEAILCEKEVPSIQTTHRRG